MYGVQPVQSQKVHQLSLLKAAPYKPGHLCHVATTNLSINSVAV